ncbi:MAG: hypothetical protein QOJ94_2251 [Sphingomonadales bacterium]|jgi:hypothetical protein|nr:hypothetical protein [Sphingomonadales bacterium]
MRVLAMAIAAISGSCATAVAAGPATVAVSGRLVVKREARIYDFAIIPSPPGGVKPTECISGRFYDGRQLSYAFRHLQGRRVRLTARIFRFFPMAASDPLAATVDFLQNECGNAYALQILHIARLRSGAGNRRNRSAIAAQARTTHYRPN